MADCPTGRKLVVPLAGNYFKGFSILDARSFLGLFVVTRIGAVCQKGSCLVSPLSGFGKRNIRVYANGQFFSFPSKRYFKFQSFPPVGVTNKKSPPPSNSFRGFWVGLIVRTLVSVSGAIRLGMVGSPPFWGLPFSLGGLSLSKKPPNLSDFTVSC